MLTFRQEDPDNGIVRWTYTLDDEGNRLQADVDEGDDGVVDVRYTYTYVAGDRDLVEGDRGLDGTVDEVFDYEYPGPGPLDLVISWDVDNDGVIDSTYTFTHDEAERLVRYTSVDSGGNGSNSDYFFEGEANDVYDAEHHCFEEGVEAYAWLVDNRTCSKIVSTTT